MTFKVMNDIITKTSYRLYANRIIVYTKFGITILKVASRIFQYLQIP